MFYPIYLDLRGRRCLVVGGGPIASGKVDGLVHAGARVTVVAPDASAAIAAWHAEGALDWRQREFEPADIDGHFLVIAATDNRELNAFVYQLADRQQRVANAVDDLDNCNFIAPAIAQRGALQVAVSTAGKSPALAKQLRDRIQRDVLTEHAADLAEFLGQWRPAGKRDLDSYPRRQAFWEGVLEGCVPELLARGERPRAEDVMRELLRRSQHASNPAARCAAGTDRHDACRACKGV